MKTDTENAIQRHANILNKNFNILGSKKIFGQLFIYHKNGIGIPTIKL